MQRQRGELVPIGEVVSGLDDVPAIRDDSPQARRGFTVADQVDRLVWASEAAPDRGFMARMMALCSLPRTNPRDRLRYVRRNGPYTLVMNAGGLYKLPFGHLPRLLMAWISTEAVRTQSRVLVLGDSLSDFMRDYLGLAHELKRALATYTESGGTGKTALDQEEAVAVMLEKHEICCGLFHGFDRSKWTTGTPQERLGLLPTAQEHILVQENGKDRYVQSVRERVPVCRDSV